MIFDFNVPYSAAGYEIGGYLPYSILERAKFVMFHACSIPVLLIRTIAHLALTALMGVADIFTLCQFNFFRDWCFGNFMGSIKCIASTPVAVMGLFIPINAVHLSYYIHSPSNN